MLILHYTFRFALHAVLARRYIHAKPARLVYEAAIISHANIQVFLFHDSLTTTFYEIFTPDVWGTSPS